MFTYRKLASVFASLIVIFSLTFSGFQPLPVSAQSGDDGRRQVNPQQGGDEVKREVNPKTGRVSFIGPESGRMLPAAKALGTFIRPQDPALALVNRYAPEFGIKDPGRELSEIKTSRPEDGRVSVRYQQNYQGIPVLGGELIVNTNRNGDLYSMNGEVSPNLALQTKPTIDSAQATQSALQEMAKWYQKTPADFVASAPQLWIYDESLLQTSTRPVELVWRMDVTAVDNSAPVRELVLVNAEQGSISLHFNQIDTAWAGAEHSKNIQTLNAPISSPKNPVNNGSAGTTHFTTENIPLLAPATWYVATTGLDANSCTAIGSPCLTINGVLAKVGFVAGDKIKVATGTYTGTGIEVVLINKSVTLSGGWNSGFTTQSGTSTIDGQTSRRGITIDFDMSVTIERFTVQNGLQSSPGGGGILNNGNLILENAIINGNDSSFGGGGILNNSVLTLNTSTVNGNAHSGLYNNGTMTVNNSTISNNIGGGIRSGGYLVLNNSTVSSNSGGNGIFNGGTLILNNSTISDNTITGDRGGGIQNDGNATINNSTITGNNASAGGGISNLYGISLILRNSIVAGNTSVNGPDCYDNSDYGGLITSAGYNLIGNTALCAYTPSTGDLINVNAKLTSLGENGGPTFTHALIVGSIAINAGNPAAPGSGGNACLATDQRGTARPVGAKCDIGAFEGSVVSTLIETYTANLSSSLPGNFLCDQSNSNCTNGSNPHADGAHKYALGTYNFYATKFLRDSIDNKGLTITSTVQYCEPGFACPLDNSFWSGTQMVYGSYYGDPLADDIVAHELTHGVTQYESNLFYYYQAGAISESLSDVFGEYYDQVGNVTGGDTAGVKWIIGEDIGGWSNPAPLPAIGLRSMSNPPAYQDPDKMTSVYYYAGSVDNGGVHWNSGVNNKAVYLMVDGGFFNGKTVTGLGWEKTGAIYYEAQTNLLTSGADYSDLYLVLQQACTNLIGQKGIVVGDCTQVKNALDAVEMNIGQPLGDFEDPSFEYSYATYPYWDQSSTNYGTPLCTVADCTNGGGTAGPRTGSVWGWLGGTTDYEAASLSQTVYFPDGYPSLRLKFYLWIGIANAGSDTNDVFTAQVDGVTVFSANATQTSLYPAYTLVSVDVSAFATNALHTITFSSVTSGQVVNFNLDDISLIDDSRTLTGNAGVGGATLSYTDGTPKTAMADGSGNYSISVPYGWSGTVTPSKAGYTFTPVTRNYVNVISNQTAQNYVALVMITGKAGVGGATLSYVDGATKTVTADGSGNYTITIPYDWTGTVTPGKACYTFNPPNQGYSHVIANQTALDYIATYNASITYTLTGNTSLPGVTLSYVDGSPKTVISDSSGNYSLTVPCTWTGTLTPSLTGYLFAPAVRNYSTLTTNQTAQNYNLYTVSPADFNGDGKTDVAVFRPSNSTWYISGQGPTVFGAAGDIPVPADYNGDGKDDIAVFRPSNSTWYINGQGSFTYGQAGDIPVVADYNGDGKADIAVFRPTNSTWYIYGVGPFVYGTVGDIPVIADYNGDGKADIAVFRPTNSTWYLYGIGPRVYGTVGDVPVIADYNGDGKADVAVFRPTNSTWYIYGIGPSVYGTVGDIPAIGDYDGDGKADITVFRPSNSTWYKYGVGPSVFGTVGDIPL